MNRKEWRESALQERWMADGPSDLTFGEWLDELRARRHRFKQGLKQNMVAQQALLAMGQQQQQSLGQLQGLGIIPGIGGLLQGAGGVLGAFRGIRF